MINDFLKYEYIHPECETFFSNPKVSYDFVCYYNQYFQGKINFLKF